MKKWKSPAGYIYILKQRLAAREEKLKTKNIEMASLYHRILDLQDQLNTERKNVCLWIQCYNTLAVKYETLLISVAEEAEHNDMEMKL